MGFLSKQEVGRAPALLSILKLNFRGFCLNQSLIDAAFVDDYEPNFVSLIKPSTRPSMASLGGKARNRAVDKRFTFSGIFFWVGAQLRYEGWGGVIKWMHPRNYRNSIWFPPSSFAVEFWGKKTAIGDRFKLEEMRRHWDWGSFPPPGFLKEGSDQRWLGGPNLKLSSCWLGRGW